MLRDSNAVKVAGNTSMPLKKFEDTGKQYRLKDSIRLCSDAFQDCVEDGVVDEDCLRKYKECDGNLADHCDLACIRTPGVKCQEQCVNYSQSFGSAPMRSGRPAASQRSVKRSPFFFGKF